MKLGRFSLGIGDRFGREGAAQLGALLAARAAGIEVTPVWNKSAREHAIIGSKPADTRAAADAAVAAAGWDRPYFVDADHVNLSTVDPFIASCDFFTIDVTDALGRSPDPAHLIRSLDIALPLIGMKLPGVSGEVLVDRKFMEDFSGKCLLAVVRAGEIYRRIAQAKRGAEVVIEISMDEAEEPQSPAELFFILGMAAAEGIPLATVAPKWSGRFCKGVDYAGDPDRFEAELNAALAAVELAKREFALPADLKLSMHSGSDKFSLFPRIRRALERTGAGLHLKTAGTTWLEEVASLAAAGGDAWEFVKRLYGRAFSRFDELCGPYLPVLDIDRSKLPAPGAIESWTGEDFAAAVRHVEGAGAYNPHLRQLVHVGYKIAAEAGEEFLRLLDKHRETIGKYVRENLLDRHILPLFPAG